MEENYNKNIILDLIFFMSFLFMYIEQKRDFKKI